MARPAAGCGLELETTHLTLLVCALWVAGGRSTSQRHQRERGGSAGLYSQTEAQGSKSQELRVSLWHRLSSWPLFEVSFVVSVSSSVRGRATLSHGHRIPEVTF